MSDELERTVPVEAIGTIALLNKSEIDQQIATAHAYPRSLQRFHDDMLSLVTRTEQTAADCIYALPRGGKTIEGPSARFAELVMFAWGNSRAASRVVSEDDQFVTTQGAFFDLEQNNAIAIEVKRPIVDSHGRRYKRDMIATTSNAAGSIALRNATLKVVPKVFWWPLYEAARQVVRGDVRTLANRRGEALKLFVGYGVSKEKIFALLDVRGEEDITLEHLLTLRGIATAIKEGDTTPEAAFANPAEDATQETQNKARATLETAREQMKGAADPQAVPGPKK